MQHSKRKKLITIIIVLLVSCACLGAIGFYSLQPQLITGRKDDLQQIIVVEHDFREGRGGEGEPKSITTITDPKTMCAIYDELLCTWPIKETHGETFYTMVSPRYELIIYYTTEIDEISVHSEGAVRYLRHPDWFTASNRAKAEHIMKFLELITENGQK